jgi:TM2 domain-containing membrane protein YozV
METQSMSSQSSQPPVFYKNPGIAAVLSFFWMGLGQIYNGQIAKGVAFIIAYAISWVLTLVLIGFITTPILFIYGMYDAYRSAIKVNLDLARRTGQNEPIE